MAFSFYSHTKQTRVFSERIVFAKSFYLTIREVFGVTMEMKHIARAAPVLVLDMISDEGCKIYWAIVASRMHQNSYYPTLALW